jgi:hypothetical protein
MAKARRSVGRQAGQQSSGKEVKALFRRRRDKYLKPAMRAAYLLDPKHFDLVGDLPLLRTSELSDAERSEVVEELARLGEVSILTIEEELLLLDEGNWEKPMILHATGLLKALSAQDKDGKPVQVSMFRRRAFWSRFAVKMCPVISRVAERLLSCHASSSAAERNWSAWGRLYTALRSSLSHEMAEKLLFIKANMPADDAAEEEELAWDL